MNTQSNTMPEAFQAQSVVPVRLSTPRVLYWSVRRELCENRSLYLAPLAVAGLVLIGSLLGTIHAPERMRAALALSPMEQIGPMMQHYRIAALILMGIEVLIAVFYCLDALHGERRDRSILFWKSLPVSDVTTVLSKASIPLLVVPVITFAVTLATQWIMLLMDTAVLLASGVRVAPLWSQVPWFQLSVMLLYHLVAIHGLWFAPFYAYLILVSGWARRAVVVWAAIPLAAIGVIEKIAFNSSHFVAMLQAHFMGGPGAGDFTATGGPMTHPLTLLTLGEFLVSPGLWIGLVIAAAFLAAAVRLRRKHGPI
jgi:ABC-2 type transport system permease protein